MKKTIALGGAALCLAFLPLNAHAQSSSTSSTDSSYQQSEQQAGTVEEQPSADTSKSESTTRTETTKSQAMREDHWKNAKSCTDDMGKTFKRGSKGFSKCVDQQRQKEQMGGMAPETRTEERTEKKTETAPSDSSMSSSHSDSSDSQNR